MDLETRGRKTRLGLLPFEKLEYAGRKRVLRTVQPLATFQCRSRHPDNETGFPESALARIWHNICYHKWLSKLMYLEEMVRRMSSGDLTRNDKFGLKESGIMKKYPTLIVSRRWICWGIASLLQTPLFGQAVDQDPVVIGSWPGYSRYEVKSLTLSSNYAYLMAGEVLIYDVTLPTQPQRVGTYVDPSGSSILKLAVKGHYAYAIGWPLGLQVLDISDPSKPLLLGASTDILSPESVTVSGDLLFVGDGTPGLSVFDLTEPINPLILGSIATRGVVEDISVTGHLAVLAEGGSGIEIIDLSDPAHLASIGGCILTGNANAVAVAGELAYVAAGDGGLNIVDINNPLDPRIKGKSFPFSDTQGVAVLGKWAFLATGAQGLQAIDISNPAIPITLGTIALNGQTSGVALAGNYAFVADMDLQVIDVTKPAVLRKAWFAAGGSASGVAAAGHYAYLADGNGGLQVIDIANSASPRRVAGYSTGGRVGTIDISGDYVYLGDDSGLSVIDISNPIQPRLAGAVTARAVSDVVVRGGLAYIIAAKDRVQIIDVSLPMAPKKVGECAVSGGAAHLAVSSSYAYTVATHYGLQIIDTGDPAAPRLAGTYESFPTDSGHLLIGVAVTGHYAFVLCMNADLYVMDVANPAHPQVAGIYPAPSTSLWANGLTIYRDKLYLVGNGLNILDISDPPHPRLFGGARGFFGGSAARVVDHRLYIAAGYSGLVLVDLPDSSPRFEPGIRMDAAGCHVFFQGLTGQTLQLQGSPDLGTWQDLAVLAATGQVQEWVDAGAAGKASRFYRMVAP